MMMQRRATRLCTLLLTVTVIYLFLHTLSTLLGLYATTKISETILTALYASSKNDLCYPNPQISERYAALKSHNLQYFFAMNLHENSPIMPDFIIQLMEVIMFLGTDHVFISIYESGSNDQTKADLVLFEDILTAEGVRNRVVLGDEHLEVLTHRIEFLARMRNKALIPLGDAGVFDKLVFMNDVYFCANDILELIWQSVNRDADLVCGLDYDSNPKDGLGFYDTWVSKDVDGNMFVKRPVDQFVSHIPSRERLENGLPFPVYCCWNGVAVLNAVPFQRMQNPIRFSRGETVEITDETDERYQKYRKGRALYEDCSESEISQMCREFAHDGFNKKLVVPRVKFAYDWNTYRAIRERLYPIDDRPFDKEEDAEFEFPPKPETVECHPLERPGWRDPDGIIGDLIL